MRIATQSIFGQAARAALGLTAKRVPTAIETESPTIDFEPIEPEVVESVSIPDPAEVEVLRKVAEAAAKRAPYDAALRTIGRYEGGGREEVRAKVMAAFEQIRPALNRLDLMHGPQTPLEVKLERLALANPGHAQRLRDINQAWLDLRELPPDSPRQQVPASAIFGSRT